MKKLCCIIICIILACAVFSSCSDKETPPVVDPVVPSNTIERTEHSVPPQKENDYEEGTYTLMIYMCGSDLETRTGEGTKNITDILSAKLPSETKVIIQTGGAKAWRKYDISSAHSSRYEVKDGSLVLIEQNARVNMGLTSTLSDFLLWGDEMYPAEHRSLILWDHGGGTMKGICFDEQYSYDALTLPELKTAFSTAFAKSNRKYDFIGFDACLMANYDTACIVKDYADYMIASEELEPASGWDYKALVSYLGKDDFYTQVLNAYAEKQAAKTTYTLSVIKLSELSRADVIIDGLIEQINYDLSYVGAAIAEGKEFGAKEISLSTNLFDLGLLAEAIGIEYDFSGFITKVNGSTHDKATGISIYFPTEQQEQLAAYSEICTNQRYVDFLNEYFNRQPETPISFISRGYNADGYLAFTLSKPSYSYVQTVGYILHSYAGSEQTHKLFAVGTDNDVSLSDGVFTVNFSGRWVYLNDMLLTCDVFEETSTHTTYSAPVLIDGELASLLFTQLDSTGQITVDGYLLFADTTSRVCELTAGAEVSVIYKDPLSDNNNLYYEEGTVVWGEDTVLSVRNLDAGRYQYIPYIVDIYGNVYYANTATVYFDGTKSVIEDISAG
ncbi:MAG: clostripain-related cysteine peptidase [Saccharofermentanales bacterium]|jgi:hypothetical protein